MNYYNENDPKCAAWLRKLIAAKLIPKGDIDERSIREVKPTELVGYAQHHFFAGIGGWSAALRLAGWPDDKPVWTGSCPCQPFSCAGKRKGSRDARHLWPVWFRLIAEYGGQHGIPVTFGEQVASAAGRVWLSGVRSSLETLGYRVRAADLCAASVGAPNIRQRLYWVAESSGKLIDGEMLSWRRRNGPTDCAAVCSMVDSNSGGSGFWSDYDWLQCRDGKQRRFKPGIYPLVARISGRVVLLRGYGNAICVPLAVEFIKAYLESC